MAMKNRLARGGSKTLPLYSIVAADSRMPRDGRFIETLGYYNPRLQDERVNLERIEYWLENGAQPSETVQAIIKRAREGKSMTPPPKQIPEPEAPAITPDTVAAEAEKPAEAPEATPEGEAPEAAATTEGEAATAAAPEAAEEASTEEEPRA